MIGEEPANTGKIRNLQRKLYLKAKAEHHKVPTHGTRRFTYTAVYGARGVLRLNPRRHDATPCA